MTLAGINKAMERGFLSNSRIKVRPAGTSACQASLTTSVQIELTLERYPPSFTWVPWLACAHSANYIYPLIEEPGNHRWHHPNLEVNCFLFIFKL